MQNIVNLREANQHLSKYINQLEKGDEIVITKHGKPVARLLPVIDKIELSDEKRSALVRLRQRGQKGYQLGGKGVNREELYD